MSQHNHWQNAFDIVRILHYGAPYNGNSGATTCMPLIQSVLLALTAVKMKNLSKRKFLCPWRFRLDRFCFIGEFLFIFFSRISAKKATCLQRNVIRQFWRKTMASYVLIYHSMLKQKPVLSGFLFYSPRFMFLVFFSSVIQIGHAIQIYAIHCIRFPSHVSSALGL